MNNFTSTKATLKTRSDTLLDSLSTLGTVGMLSASSDPQIFALLPKRQELSLIHSNINPNRDREINVFMELDFSEVDNILA